MSDSFELELTGMAHGGPALGRHEGRVIFVPYTLPGERVRVRITSERRNFAHGEAVEVLRPSPARVEPLCPHFGPGLCGGCQWQHIAYEQQLEYKQAVVRDQLRRIGKFRDPEVRPTYPSPLQWGYRVYMTFTMTAEGKPALWSDDNSRLIPIERCHILHPALVEVYEQLELNAPEVERIKFQVGSDPDDRMIILMTRDDLAPEIEVDLPVSVNLLLSDNEPVNLIGNAHVKYRIFEREFRVTAGSFFQANPPVAEMLVEEVLKRLNLQGDEVVLDLYSGVGLFTAFIAERADMVLSVESYPPAVTDADQNLADLDNVELVEGAVEAVLDDLVGPFDAAVLDPPRSGLSPRVVRGLSRLSPPVIVYVSCDPATLARDASQLSRAGYRLVDVQPVDMFPQTYHIECIATLLHR
ncbi:MAG TPA: class I SAM-dependent RNA methyltransferase [Chloroflexi bacterium]|nr:class I SAM-dependent RNA methyltransferase [Chloroflexota bacterium]